MWLNENRVTSVKMRYGDGSTEGVWQTRLVDFNMGFTYLNSGIAALTSGNPCDEEGAHRPSGELWNQEGEVVWTKHHAAGVATAGLHP